MATNQTQTIIHWIARVAAAIILGIGAAPKIMGKAVDLADKLPGDYSIVAAIGAVEILAIVLLLIPKTALIGSTLAVMIMIGAIGSHVMGPVGFEGQFAMMFGLAVGALIAAGVATYFGVKRKCFPLG